MPVRLRSLALLILVLLAISATSALAKPLYCNYACYPPYNHGPEDPCTCPAGTPYYGLITTCGDYFGGICTNPDSLTNSGDEAQCRVPDDLVPAAEAAETAEPIATGP